jgi:hypothetical protein
MPRGDAGIEGQIELGSAATLAPFAQQWPNPW